VLWRNVDLIGIAGDYSPNLRIARLHGARRRRRLTPPQAPPSGWGSSHSRQAEMLVTPRQSRAPATTRHARPSLSSIEHPGAVQPALSVARHEPNVRRGSEKLRRARDVTAPAPRHTWQYGFHRGQCPPPKILASPAKLFFFFAEQRRPRRSSTTVAGFLAT